MHVDEFCRSKTERKVNKYLHVTDILNITLLPSEKTDPLIELFGFCVFPKKRNGLFKNAIGSFKDNKSFHTLFVLIYQWCIFMI